MRATRSATRIVAIDDHPLVLQGLSAQFDPALFDLVAMSLTGRDGLKAVCRERPDAVITDLRLPDVLGPTVCSEVKRLSPPTRVLVLTGYEDVDLLRMCMEAGADAVLLKDLKGIDLQEVVGTVVRGGSYVDDRLVDRLLGVGSASSAFGITSREFEVLQSLAEGLSTAEIAARLHLTVNTVRSYAQTLLEKLGVRSRIEAVAKARELRVL